MPRNIHTTGMMTLVSALVGSAACSAPEPTDVGVGRASSLAEAPADWARLAANDRKLLADDDDFDSALERDTALRLVETGLDGTLAGAEAHGIPGSAEPRNDCDGLFPGTGDYCSISCTCEHGEGDCDANAHCSANTYCKPDVGTDYGYAAVVDVCVHYPECVAAPGTYHATVAGRGAYCSATCKCGHGEGDCDSDAECATGTHCVADVGVPWGYASTVDVCMHYPECAYSAGTYHSKPAGNGSFCTDACKCAAGEGDCDSDAECGTGLVCRSDLGAYYGFAAIVDVCQDPAATCSSDDDCTGDWWCLGSSCAYGHTITINGSLDFDTTNEQLATVTPSYKVYFAWDESYLYVAMTGDSVGGGDSTHYVLLYLDGVANNYTTTGMAHGSQQPGLPFGAGYHIAWRADNGSTVAYVHDGNNWVNANWNFTGDVYQSGTTVEFRIPLGATDGINLGALPADVAVHVSMIDANDNWTWAGCPADSYAENPAGSGGANDPDYAKYYSFTIGGTAVPILYSSQ